MSNELIFLSIIVSELLIVLLAWKLGKEWLIATILANIVITMIFEAKLSTAFGLATTCGAVFYSSIFIATDILSEHHGKRIAYQSIWMGFLCLLILLIMSQLILQLVPLDEGKEVSDAFSIAFAQVPRITIAGFISYMTAQSFDIWFFHFIREKTGMNKLWLRNNLSTLTSMLLDSCIFFPLAFYGTVPNDVLLTLVVSGWLFKAPIALFDTPFLYLSYVIKGQTPPDFGKMTVQESERVAAGLE